MLPVSLFHTRTLPSAPAETSRLPSGSKTNRLIPLVCPLQI